MGVSPSRLVASRRVVAGGRDDFMVVHHLVLEGSGEEIGRALAEEARRSSAWMPPPADPIRNRARRRWFQQNWPEHHARMKGIANAFSQRVDDDDVDFSSIFGQPIDVACSAAWCSPRTSTDGHARVGRNLDFSTQTVSELMGAPSTMGELPVFFRPFVIETHPRHGYASIVATVGDLTGCLDGINEHGLTVAVLSDDRSPVTCPTMTAQAGLHEMHVLRYLLDRCRSAAEARDALLEAKQYDQYSVAHHLVADENDAFVWERIMHNVERLVEVKDETLCVTNHLLSVDNTASQDQLADPATNDTYLRERTLDQRLAGNQISNDALWAALEAVSADARSDGWNAQRGRTLWHSQYDISSRNVTFEFYLGDRLDGTPRRSAPVSFDLSAGGA